MRAWCVPQATIGYDECLAKPGYTNRHGWPQGPFEICGLGMYKSTVGRKCIRADCSTVVGPASDVCM